MSADNLTEAEAFYAFLGDEIANGGKSKTPEALLEYWRQSLQWQQSVDAVSEGFEDGEAGRMTRVRDLLAEAGRQDQT